MATTASTSASFGVPASSVGPSASALPPARREAVNASLTAFLDKELGKQVTLAVGASVDVGQLAILTASLKTGLRAKLGASLGIGGGISAGGVGGTAGGGNTLEVGAGTNSTQAGGASGKVGGVASGGLSLGAGLGTRATASFAAGGKVALGTAVGGNYGVGAKAGIGGSGSAPVSVKAGASIKTSVSTALDGAMLKAGLSSQERASLKSELQPAINRSVDDSFKSAFGPDLGYPNARGVALLGVSVTMQTRGNWLATCEVDHKDDEQEIPTGPFKFDIDGVEFSGTVMKDRAGTDMGGRQKIRVVGGAGGLDTEIQAKNYAGGLTKVRTIVGDILRDSGESLSIESSDSFLDQRVIGWHRSEGTAKEALTVLCDRIGCEWRVLRDGTVWIGEDTWPEIEPAGTVMDQDFGSGVVTVAPEFPTLVPGVIVRGQKINQVTHRFAGSAGLRSDLHATSMRQLADGMQERSKRANQYGFRYRCEVTRQNADGSVDVLIDDERMRGKGVAKCKMRHGFPGATVRVRVGARCLVGWDDANPSFPYVSDWEDGQPFETIDIG